MSIETMKSFVYSAVKPYSAILFLNSRFAGLVLLAITFINPSVALSGILAVLFTIAFAEALHFKEAYLSQGFYIYNSLLVGMGIGYIFSPSVMSILLISILSALTFMLSFMFNRLFSTYKIPILSLPFSLVTMFAYLASVKYSGLLSALVNNASMSDIEFPLVLSAFFKSFGSIFFLPSNAAGLLIVLLILYFSRITLIMGIIGFYFGVLVHSYLLGSFTQALYDPYAFNYILVAIALCGIFLLPTVKNFFLALIGVAISVVLTDAIAILFNYYAIPVFTLPFNITVISFIFILSMIYYEEFNIEIKATPEESLSNYLSKVFRFGTMDPKIGLPFTSEWSVYQAFDGEWTHKGKYRHAYDFVKKTDGKSYKNEGLFLDDYYSYGESVLSPVNGYVVDFRSDLPDNHIGEVDHINNWGNYIIIRSDLGFYVEISHLMQHSVQVEAGSYVQENSIIAKCGNSGYSPEPHIHIQVQELPVIGAFTKVFTFSEYIINEKLLLNTRPKTGDSVCAATIDKSIASRFLFILDDTLTYDVYENDIKTSTVTFTVKMDDSGAFYFQDAEHNRLYFYSSLKEFYFYRYEGKASYLKQLFVLAPRIPFISMQTVSYTDYLPVYLLKTKLEQIYIEWIAIFHKDFYKQTYTYTFNGSAVQSIHGKIDLNKEKKGFESIAFRHTRLVTA